MAAELKHTVKPSGGDYTTLDAAVDHIVAAHADLVAADVYATIEIDGTWSSADTAAVSISSSIITDATRYLHIYTTAAARHNGKWDTGAYILAPVDSTGISIGSVEFLRIDGLQISPSSPTANSRHCITFATAMTAGGDQRISNCVLKGHGHASLTQAGVNATASYVVVSVWNCIAYNFTALSGNVCYYLNVSTGALTVYSSTAIGGQYGLRRTAGSYVAKNVYAGGSLSGDYSGTITQTTCASSDSTGGAGLQSIPVSAATFVNVGAGTEDYHLAVGSALIGVGTDTSGDAAPMDFTTDIDGDART